MKFSDLNLVKTNKEIGAIKAEVAAIASKVDELLVTLPVREKAILDAIELSHQTDLSTADIITSQREALSKQESAIAKQDESIAKLESLNAEKQNRLSGLTKLIILVALGAMSLAVRYDAKYSNDEGLVITPHPDPGAVLPITYAVAFIAIATGNDEKIGSMLEGVGRKIGG